MKILIPSAKEMNNKVDIFVGSTPQKTLELAKLLNSFSVDELAKLYKIKIEQAEIEKTRFENITNNNANFYIALHLFNGLMYRNINREKLNGKEQSYLKANIFITSAFYGIINVYEKISEYRLDFQQKIKIDNKTLKQYWQQDYDNFVKGEELVISLLSSEFEEIFSKEIREKFITITFMEEVDREYKTHSTISKKARGKFVSELARKQVTTIEQIKKITFDGYKYNKKLSNERKLVFVAKRGE